MDLGLENAAVCVQRGPKGMGRAAAECFPADRARVVVDETVASPARLGSPDAFGIRVDLADPPTIDVAFAEIGRRCDELDTSGANIDVDGGSDFC